VNISRLLPAKISITRQVTFDFCSSQSTKIPSATEPLDYAVFPYRKGVVCNSAIFYAVLINMRLIVLCEMAERLAGPFGVVACSRHSAGIP